MAALAGTASASMMTFLTVEELSQASSQVVRARILGQTVHWTPLRDGIYTEIEAVVLGEIDGAPSPTAPSLHPGRGPIGPRRVTIIQTGGEIDGVSLDWTGRPRFQVDEDLVLFLQPYDPANPADSRLLVVGGKQGRMRVLEDPQGLKPTLVQRDLAGVMDAPLIENDEPKGPGHRRDLMPLEELRQRARHAHVAMPQGGKGDRP